METFYLIYKILKKLEQSSVDWRQDSRKNHTLLIQQQDYGQGNEHRQQMNAEAIRLEEMGYVKCKWFSYHQQLEHVVYSDTKKEQFYAMAERTPKYLRIQQYRAELEKKKRHTSKAWICSYYEDLIQRLSRGRIPEEFEYSLSKGQAISPREIDQCFRPHGESEGLFHCLEELDRLEGPIFQRVFSKKCFCGSKVFEREFQDRIVRLVRKYGKEDPQLILEEGMGEADILAQIYLLEYGATLNVKGQLKLRIQGKEVDTGDFYYGCELNSDTLKHAEILPNQRLHKIITVENKANFMSMFWEEGTLILFSHGYPSPAERRFLQKLYHVLEEQPVVYYHTGDLDYGGICIFRHLRRRIFPELRPLRMDLEVYETYADWMGTPLGETEASTRQLQEKLRGLEEPLLQPLIDRLAETGIGIEQEVFLIKSEIRKI